MFEEFQWFSEKPLKKCPSCGKKKLFKVITGGAAAIVRGNPTTFGQAAEENAKRLGKEKMALMADEYKNAKKEARLKLPGGAKKVERPKEVPPPWWRDGSIEGLPKQDKPLDLKKVKDVKEYIRTGRK